MKSRGKESFGEMLRRVRTERGIGLRKLAARVGMSSTYLSKIELGQMPPPAWDKLIALADALDSDELWSAGRNSLIQRFKNVSAQALTASDRLDPELRERCFGDYEAWKRFSRSVVKDISDLMARAQREHARRAYARRKAAAAGR